MTTRHVLLGVAWGASLAGAYVWGLNGGARKVSRETPTPATAAPQASAPALSRPAVESSNEPEGIDSILGERDASRRQGRIAQLTTAADEATLTSWLTTLAGARPSRARDDLTSALYRRWGQLNPSAALESLRQMPLRERIARENDVVAGWCLVDTAAAWQWLENEPAVSDSPLHQIERSGRFRSLVDALLVNGRVDAATQLVSQLPPGNLRSIAADSVAQYLGKYDLERAVSWILEQPAGSPRANVAATTARALAQESPDLAADFALRLPAPTDQVSALLVVFQESGATGDIEAAEGWLKKREPDPAVDAALEGFIPAIASKDPDMALRLTQQIAEPMVRQSAIKQALTNLTRTSPAAAIDWVIGTASTTDRQAGVEKVMTEWARRDASAASRYLEQSRTLTDDERSYLRRTIPALGGK